MDSSTSKGGTQAKPQTPSGAEPVPARQRQFLGGSLNAIGQPSQPVSGTDPPVWLAPWAANVFKVVFVQDPDRSDVSHERYRLEIHGDMSLADFESNLLGNTTDGFFNK